MSYSRGFLKDRVGILNREEASVQHGAKIGGEYTLVKSIWANVSFTKGVKAMREGALDAYEVLMVRTAYHPLLTRTSQLKINNKRYEIESFNADKSADEMQITCFEIVK